jgi:hypothetical protein
LHEMSAKLALPVVDTIAELHSCDYTSDGDNAGHFSIITPARSAGRKHRYNVLRIFLATHRAVLIGCELPLREARRAARRISPLHA